MEMTRIIIVTQTVFLAMRRHFFALCVLLFSHASFAMVEMGDEQLSRVTGQALLQMNKTPGTGVSNNTNFYKAGLDAILEINMNIQKLQLGCGGVNGPGCDIDIDNLSLSGNCETDRPGCSAQLTRPFVEFAVKNDHTATLREITGFRLSAELAEGLLTAGQNDGTPNGINTLSGYMSIAASSGSTQTAAGNFTNGLTGRANIGGCVSGCPVTYNTNNAGIPLPSIDVDFDVPAFEVIGQRLQSIELAATSTIPDIALEGTRSATMQGCFWMVFIPLCNYTINELNITGTLRGLKTDITIQEDLGLIHKIPINNPFSLSMQKENVLWPDAPAVAQQGWWMSFSDPIQLGSLSTPDGYQVDISSAYGEVAQQVSQYLTDNPLYIPFGDAIGTVFSGSYDADVGIIDLSSYSAVNVNLQNLPLGTAQDVPSNCYGSATFC